MKYALNKNERVEAKPGMKGSCQCCSGQMIAKCGRYVTWHWAHKRIRDCDEWWEAETDWHRSWKNRFPRDWQEILQIDQDTGEKHVADVKTPYGLVIEMQNSPLNWQELRSREQFYKKIVWVVNGDRLGPTGKSATLDRSFFEMGLDRTPIRYDPLVFQLHWQGKSKFLHKWSEAEADVFLDFGGGILWRFDSFDPNAIARREDTRSKNGHDSQDRELFPRPKIYQEIQFKLAELTPIRIDEFLTCCKNGLPITGGFNRDQVGLFKRI